jgi:hypothetical protein
MFDNIKVSFNTSGLTMFADLANSPASENTALVAYAYRY